MRRGGSAGGAALPTVGAMNTPHTTRSVPRLIGRTTATAVAATTLLGAAALPSSAEPTAVPIAGDIVTCTIDGAPVQLVGVSGYVVQEETTRIDAQGRARTLFTIRASHARLAGPDGTSYRLTGGGFDRVLYPTEDNTGDVQREHIQYHFTVVGPTGRAGVVRFSMRIGPGTTPVFTDRSTCQLPQGSAHHRDPPTRPAPPTPTEEIP